MKTQSYRHGLLATTMIAGALVAATATPSFAQTAPQDGEAATVEEIVVTGSRIRVRDTTGTSPIVTVGADALEEIGTASVETYLTRCRNCRRA